MDKQLVNYCMTCGKIELDGLWVLPEKPLGEYQLSHGYCEPCGEKAIKEALAQIAKIAEIRDRKAVQNDI